MKNIEFDFKVCEAKRISSNRIMNLSTSFSPDGNSEDSDGQADLVRHSTPFESLEEMNRSHQFKKKRMSELTPRSQKSRAFAHSPQAFLREDFPEKVKSSESSINRPRLSCPNNVTQKSRYQVPPIVTDKRELQNAELLKSFNVSSRTIYSNVKGNSGGSSSAEYYWHEYESFITSNYESHRQQLREIIKVSSYHPNSLSFLGQLRCWSGNQLGRIASLSRNPSFEMSEIKGTRVHKEDLTRRSLVLHEQFQIHPQKIEERPLPGIASSILKLDNSEMSLFEDDLNNSFGKVKMLHNNLGELLENEIYEIVDLTRVAESSLAARSLKDPFVTLLANTDIEELMAVTGAELSEEQAKYIRFRNKLEFMLRNGLLSSSIMVSYAQWMYLNDRPLVLALLSVFELNSKVIRRLCGPG